MKVLLLGAYAPHALKGLIAGSDREAAVKALMTAVGGTVESIKFTRGKYDVVLEVSVPSHDALIGLVLALKASAAFELADYLEIVDMAPILEEAKKVVKVYTPAG